MTALFPAGLSVEFSRYGGDPGGNPHVYVVAGECKVAAVWGPAEQREARARLFAAAPETAQALEHALAARAEDAVQALRTVMTLRDEFRRIAELLANDKVAEARMAAQSAGVSIDLGLRKGLAPQ